MTKKTSVHQKKRPAPASKKLPGKKQDPRLWIIITDHKKAHVYQKAPGKGIRRIPDECLGCSLPLPGDEIDETSFLSDLASWLDAAVKEDAFDRIALIASPDAMKRIHPLLGKKVHGRICAALAKDVAEITEDEIEDHLADVVWL